MTRSIIDSSYPKSIGRASGTPTTPIHPSQPPREALQVIDPQLTITQPGDIDVLNPAIDPPETLRAQVHGP